MARPRKLIWAQQAREYVCPACGCGTFLLAEQGVHYYKVYGFEEDGEPNHMESSDEDVTRSWLKCWQCEIRVAAP
ncbi:hypothetical protein GCM10028801_31340 [Nocardioides maradonensis]